MLSRARGGKLWRRPAVAVPVEADGQVGEALISSLPTPKPEKKGLLNAYLRVLDKRPLPTKIVTSGIICAIGDVMAQALSFATGEAGPFTLGSFARALEFQRLIIYGVLGALWMAPVVHYWFDALEDLTKGNKGPTTTFRGKMGKALKMVALDQSIGAPLVNSGFMFFFTLVTALTSGAAAASAARKAGSMVRDNLWSTMVVCWKLWPVANLINFAFVPPNLRVLFMNFIGLGWNIFLSAAVN